MLFSLEVIITVQHLLLTASHDVDVLNADELELYVGVVVFIFIAFSRCAICNRI